MVVQAQVDYVAGLCVLCSTASSPSYEHSLYHHISIRTLLSPAPMAGMATAYECPILVWMISLNRDYSKEVSVVSPLLILLLTPTLGVRCLPHTSERMRNERHRSV